MFKSYLSLKRLGYFFWNAVKNLSLDSLLFGAFPSLEFVEQMSVYSEKYWSLVNGICKSNVSFATNKIPILFYKTLTLTQVKRMAYKD